MKILSELPRAEFENRFATHRDIKYFNQPTKHCYLVALTVEEYQNLGMNSSPENPFPVEGKYPLMKESVAQFLKNQSHLEKTHPDRGISGTTVKQYLEKFKKGAKLENCFITDDKIPGGYYICEGMHRLTAYGVYKKLDLKDFEVEVYYLTNQDI